MDMSMSANSSACMTAMSWNWYTIDACFLADSWHIQTHGMFAASCIAVALLVIILEFLRRASREYDAFLLRQFQRSLAAATKASADNSCKDAASYILPGQQFVTFRATPLQQLARAVIHAAMMGLAYIVMLIVMSFNGYMIISIILGALVGKFLCDWMVIRVPISGASDANVGDSAVEEPTVCCG